MSAKKCGADAESNLAGSRFHYSLEAEGSLRELPGHTAYHSAANFSNPTAAKRHLRNALKEVMARQAEVTVMDERLRYMIDMRLRKLDGYLKRFDRDKNELETVALMLEIIGRLLGFDWNTGKTFRTPIYWRSASDEFRDFEFMLSGDWRQKRDARLDIGV